MKYLLYLLLICLTSSITGLAGAAERDRSEFLVIGTGGITGGNEAAARRDAISDAHVKGMEEYLKHSIGRQGLINNFQLIINDILPDASRGITSFNILAENKHRNRYKILASVRINEKLMEERLTDLGVIVIEGLPVRLLFLISEKTHPEEDAFYWWSDPVANYQLTTIELTLHRLFQERGFRPVNRMSNVPDEFNNEIRKLNLNEEDIAEWGRLYTSNAVVFGGIEATNEGSMQIDFQVLDIEKGIIAGRYSDTFISPEGIAEDHQNLVERAVNRAVASLVPEIVNAFKETEIVINTLEIRLAGLDNFKQLMEFNNFLLNDIRGVNSVIQTRITGDILTIAADFTGSTELFISRIRENLNFPFPADVRLNREGVVIIDRRRGFTSDNP